MDIETVINACNTRAAAHAIELVEVGPPNAALAVDAVERGLAAFLPEDFREFLITIGRVQGWEVAMSTRLDRIVADSVTLTHTVMTMPHLKAHEAFQSVVRGEARAVAIGTVDDEDAIGDAFLIADTRSRRPGTYWLMRRGHYPEHVADDVIAWLEAFLGHALRFSIARIA